MTDNRKIESVQIKLIHIAKTNLKISNEDYRALLIKFSPTSWDMDPEKPSCKAMTYAEASALIDHLRKKGFKIVKKPTSEAKQRNPYDWKWSKKGQRSTKQSAPNIVTLPSTDQIGMIEDMILQCRWRLSDGFVRWLSKYLNRKLEDGKPWRVLIHTSREAQYVIEAMKGMLKRQQTEDSIKAQEGQQFYDRPASEGGRHSW